MNSWHTFFLFCLNPYELFESTLSLVECTYVYFITVLIIVYDATGKRIALFHKQMAFITS